MGEIPESNDTLAFRQVAEHIQDVLWLVDWHSRRLLYVSPGYETIWQRPVRGLHENNMDWIEAIHVDDRERVSTAFLKDAPEGRYDETYRIVRPDGSTRWIRDRGSPIRGATGATERIAGIAEDITAIKEAEDRQRIMTQELDHRVKNNLAVVLSIADQTANASDTIEEFRTAFTGRIRQLGGESSLQFAVDGVRCEIRLPIDTGEDPHGEAS